MEEEEGEDAKKDAKGPGSLVGWSGGQKGMKVGERGARYYFLFEKCGEEQLRQGSLIGQELGGRRGREKRRIDPTGGGWEER